MEVLDRDAAQKAGIDGVLLTVSGTPGDSAGGHVQVGVDYSGFAQAAGADYGSRLRLVQLPACVLTTPNQPECRTALPLTGSNDTEAQTVTAAAVPLPAGEQSLSKSSGVVVLAATSEASGLSGDYKATPLSAASTWSTALNTGSFAWSYDMPTPSVPGDLAPRVALSYSSASVDGRTVNSNNQASWAGDGFDLAPGFVERRYKPCGDEGVKTGGIEPGDLCWAYDNATISFNGHSGELIPVSKDEWRIKGDDATKVVRKRDANRGNGDNNGEYFVATTDDGTTYYFGYNRLSNWAAGKPETKSVFTVPVFGNDPDEECHGSTFDTSWCQQGWRWNLDLVTDTDGNDITYWYKQETNYYGRNLKASNRTPYVRGGTLDHIEYGQQKSDIYSATVKPIAKVVFGTAERCLPATGITCDPATIDANRRYWYDTPWDLNCNAGTDCDAGRYSPAFFTRTRLSKITTQTLQADGTYKDIDSWSLAYRWGTSDADYQLLLESIQHTGHAGATPITLPKTTLGYTQLANRLDKTGDGRAPFIKERLSTIADELGGQTDVTYSAPACNWASLPTPQTNTTRCYPQPYQPSNEAPVTTEWFNKYVVNVVTATDRTGKAPDSETRYSYLGGAAWHFDDDDGLTKEKLKSWSQWRGYEHVRVQTGSALAMSTQADHYYLRGMDGDRTDPANKTKTRSVTVPDGEGATLTDDQAWAGYEYRTETYSRPGGTILAKSVSTPWKKETAKRVRDWGTATANLTSTQVSRSFTSLDNGAGAAWRETRVNTTHDDLGRSTRIENLGDASAAVTDDDTCTRTTYADNAADWILTGVIRTETVAAKCSVDVNRDTRPDGTSAVLTDTRIRYDGQAWGVAPTKGHATLTETLKTRSGTNATYLDSTATYDSYGRTLTITELASTTVFDPTNDAKVPTTTPGASPRTTKTVYTPATGRPTKSTVTTPPANTSVPSSTQTTTTDYDLLRGMPVDTIDANSLRTDLLYDALGRTLKVWLPNRTKASGQSPNYEFAYNVADDAIASVAAKTLNNDGSQDTTYTLYDGFGRVRETQAPGGGGGRILTDTFYDERGQAALTYAPYYATGAPTTILFKVEDATGVETQTATVFDGLGRPTRTTLLAGNGVGTPLSSSTTIYGGDRTTVIPPKGATPTTTVFDAIGRTTQLIEYTDGSGTATGPTDITRYGYDPAGNLTLLTHAGTTWSWLYDQLGRQTRADDPDTGTTRNTYNDRGELATTTDSRGKVVASLYDNLSRLTETRDGSATGPLLTSQAWDPQDNKGMPGTSTRHVTIGSTTYKYESTPGNYDALYRPGRTTVTIPSVPGQEGLQGSYVFGTTYNLDGSIKSVAYPAVGNLAAESVAYTYDAQHRPVSIGSNLSTYLADQSYSLTGKPLQSTLKTNTSKTTWVTNGYQWGTQRLASSVTQQEGVTGAARAAAYTYDDAGNVTALVDASRTGTDAQCFTYDGLARLTEAWTTNTTVCGQQPDPAAPGTVAPYRIAYTYNPDGTRKTETRYDTTPGAQNTVRDYTYPAATGGPHSLAATRAVTGSLGAPVEETYAYDKAGHTAERHLKPAAGQTDDQVLTWDTEGRLAKIVDTRKTTAGTTVTTTVQTTDYVYDAGGNRLTAHTLDTANPSAENTVLYLGSTELTLTKGISKPTATRYYDLGAATAVRTDDNKVALQISDHHDTGTLNIDTANGAATTRRTDPFGNPRGTAPATWAGTKGFVGGTLDPTGLTHLGAREYDPTTGRFISVDPLLTAADPQSLNGYAYANNSPTTLSDPTGLCPRDLCDGYGQNPTMNSGPPGKSDPTDSPFLGHTLSDKQYELYQAQGYHGSQEFTWGDAAKWAAQDDNGWNSVCQLAGNSVEDCKSNPFTGNKDIYDAHEAEAAGIALVGVGSAVVGMACIPGVVECAATIATALTIGSADAAAGGSLLLGVDFVVGGGAAAEATGLRMLLGKIGSKECNSFTSDTAVLMADGSHKDINRIEIGDEVIATDPDTGRTESRTVTSTIYNPNDTKFADIAVKTGGSSPEITATWHHPFWSPSAHAWIDAGDLKPGLTLRTADGKTVTVTHVKRYHRLQAAYNLTVDDLHTYYVLAGATPVLVHNSNCQFWSPTDYNGQRIYQRDDLVNPDYFSPADKYGRSNLKRMQQGLAPMGPDGKPLNLHHMLQTQDGPIAEVTHSMHFGNYNQLHWKAGTKIPSGIDRDAFNAWKSQYWKDRAAGFGG
ncbi:HNH/ENDO VII family nuclease [Peterkaempfera bronchialis]|uniref:HNH/ENDO VII family nuclease n=1 Tax=Peterkaempfera bronchialis TaxID=2126346 RepID=UPI000DACD9FF|nr:HNH/ENDO VII family nuclease [Peterkaempfera bronchialis]